MTISPEMIRENIDQIRRRIDLACASVQRNAAEVTLVAVSKTVSVQDIQAAIDAGQTHFGENRIQEAKDKIQLLPKLNWHLIGSLQTNKVKTALGLFSYIHTVDRHSLVDALARQTNGADVPVFMQVNVAGEATKHGVSMEEAETLARAITAAGLKLTGLMTVAPFSDDAENVRPVFRSLRQLFIRLQELGLPGADLQHLSMGMSNDFEIAIQEGATMVRVGSAIFGSRLSRAELEISHTK